MLKKEVEKALNHQVAMEEFAARSYLSLGLWADHNGFDGTAKFFYIQSQEEYKHMRKFIDFILDAGGKPTLSTYEESIPEGNLFETGLKHEKAVSKSIHSMVELAWKEKDLPAFEFLQWFVKEQVEEEATFQKILDKIDILEKHGGSLYMLDKELGMRGEK
jgi:ferritin